MIPLWLVSVTRLAERRGKLNGDLSRVQQMALEALIIHENTEKAREDSEAVKRSLLAAGVPIEVLYPEFAQPQRVEGFDDPGEMVSTASSDEAMEIMRQLGTSIELTTDDLYIDPELLKEHGIN